MFLPIVLTGELQPTGFAVLAASASKRIDDDYRAFLSLVVSQIASAIAEARAFEYERQRAAALAELDRAKTEFFSNVSHEFRTPLTLLLGPLEDALAQTQNISAETRALVQTAHQNALRMLRLVNSLLDFARLQAGRAPTVYQPANLPGLTRELASHFHSATQRAGLAFHVECGEISQPVWVDPAMWEKIVLNLLSNAFKFTLAGSITLRLSATQDSALLTVQDTGVGIPPSELPHLFQRFHRVAGSRGRTIEGTGIGLALVQEMVRLHGGHVSVESEIGRGSTFSVSLPLGNAHLPPESLRHSSLLRPVPASVQIDSYVDEALNWVPDSSEVGAPVPKPSESAETILIADDNADMRGYLARVLSPHYHVITAPDGIVAAQLVSSARPALLLSDVMMPGLDGFSLVKKIRANPTTATIPIILLSARAGQEASSEGLDAGADDYLVKPFTARELLARVAAHLRLTHARKEAEQQATLILESITDAFFACNAQWRYTYANLEAERITQTARQDIVGRSAAEVFSEITGAALERELTSASRQTHSDFDLFSYKQHRWYRVRAYPAANGGWSLFFRDITREREAEESLRRSNEDLEQFAYVASHDLQEPLRSVKIYSQLLIRRYAGRLDAEADQFLARIIDGSERMEKLIRGLLSFAGLSTAETPLEEIELSQLVQEALANLAEAIAETNPQIEVAKMPALHVRPAQLVQVFQNLLSNSLKYRRPDCRLVIKVSATRHGNEWIFSVSDNGLGIAKDFQGKVFNLFARFHPRNVSGTGIGLASVRRIVEHHGGRVWLSSDLGAGSTFFFTLPVASPQNVN